MSAVICPTVTAADSESYRRLLEQAAAFADRLHIDLSDGTLAPNQLLAARDVWWPAGPTIDIHIMSRQPDGLVEELLVKQPDLIIVHAEADIDLVRFVRLCRQRDVRAGVALLQTTTVESLGEVVAELDHVLVFSGNLGHFGGQADLRLAGKIEQLRAVRPDLEIGWDGGVSLQNAAALAAAGVNVLNAGGAIQKADDPAAAYRQLRAAVAKVGT